jgi:hypothetical protein
MPRGNQGDGNRNRNSQGEFTSGSNAGSKSSSGRGSNSGSMSREEAARKGGEAVSRDREHMAEIGRKGGKH